MLAPSHQLTLAVVFQRCEALLDLDVLGPIAILRPVSLAQPKGRLDPHTHTAQGHSE
jgi:hypothetical protein